MGTYRRCHMVFEYNGLHLMVDATVHNNQTLVRPFRGEKLLEDIVEKINMTMILPPITVKFPHAVCEMKRVLEDLSAEGLENTAAARNLASKLHERKNETFGYSTFVMIAESHLSIHTFPELGYFSFDCYSCNEFDFEAVVSLIREHFQIKDIEIQTCTRRVPQSKNLILE